MDCTKRLISRKSLVTNSPRHFSGRRKLDSSALLSALLLVWFQGIASGIVFRAGVAKVDITPSDPQVLAGYDPRKSTGIHDRIFHRIVALDDGTTQFFLISTEL